MNSHLKRLFLSENAIGSTGCVELAEALKENSSLTALHVSNNKIGEIGAKALAKVIPISSLKELDRAFLGENCKCMCSIFSS